MFEFLLKIHNILLLSVSFTGFYFSLLPNAATATTTTPTKQRERARERARASTMLVLVCFSLYLLFFVCSLPNRARLLNDIADALRLSMNVCNSSMSRKQEM